MKWLGYPRAGYIAAAGAIATCTLVGLLLAPWLEQVNIALVYLLGVVLVALRWRRGPVVAASILAIAAYNFFFVPPSGTFHVDDPQYLLTFAMMLAVGLIVSWLTDTARRRAQAQAELAIQAETERIRNALLSSISHDLRTPLAVISGASSSLAEGGERMTAEERSALAESIFRESQGMSELVAKVLQMTRLESGGLTLERDWCSIGEIAASVVRRLKPRLAHHLVMVDMPGDLPLARVDAALIEQALANLLENAARHTPPRTLVRLRAHATGNERGGELTVSVEDFGPGLPEGDVESLFEKFRHGGRGGVGLGLAICRAIVALHGGRIWAERLPGVGTAFRFSLPLEAAPEMPVEALAR
jgi:two-component system, OmpR family, sensor histidine kinase KdpD